MTKWRLKVHDLLERKRFNELLSFCIIILDNKIEILLNSGIDIFKDGTRVKFSEVETAENLKKIIIKLGSDPYKIKTEKILSKLLQEKATIDWKRVLKTGIDDAVLCFEDINKIFNYISVCCSEISNGEIIISYMQLFHKIMPYFIIGDFFFLHLNKSGRWITERILISSILKVSERILQNKNIEFDEKDFRYSYLLWEICLCNWWKYSKIRLEYSKIPENVGNEILSIFKNSIEIFQLLSKSSITHHYKILLVYNLWFNILELKISSLFGGRIKDVCTISENNAMAFESDKHIVNILKRKISILIDNEMYDNILDMLTYFNIFTGIIIGIVHKYIKHIGKNGCDTLFNIEHTEIPPEISILFEEYIICNEKLLQKDITDLHILKIEFCLINCIVFEKTIGFFNNSSNQIIKSESKLNKEIIYSFLLTVGVVNSLLDLVLNEKLLIIIKELLYYQHNTLSRILCIGVLADWNFLRNIDGYASCLIGNVFKKVINKKCESEIDEGLKQYVVKIIIEILSMISGLIENYNNENSRDQIEDISQLPKIAMRIKTFTCEAIIRYIQYMGEINEEYFFIMEKIFEGLFSDKITKDNSKVEIDELVLGFILSISENLLRLSSQLNHKKKFQDSIRISTFGLLSLSNIISIPWIIQNDTFFQGTKEYGDIKVTYDTETSNENFDPLLTPKNIKSFPQPFETINKNTSKTETARFWRTPGCLSNGLFDMKNYYVGNHKNLNADILSTPIVSNGNFEDLQTPFTARLRNYSISQFKSQTIKRIQISTLNNCKTMTRTKKMELQTEKEYKNEYYDPESMNNDSPDYPIHILLFMLMLEQLVLSMSLFSNENSNDTPVEFHRIISLIKDNIGILFSQIDDFSFTFIFNDLEGFSLKCDEPFRQISKRTLNRSAIQMKRHFNNIILSLVSRFVKTKLLLIDGFTDVDIIDLFPESSGPRNTICRAIWMNLELSVYKSCRFGTNKYSKIFKKMIKNGFYSRLVSLFNNAIPFYNETSILVCKSKVEFLNLYNNRINLFEFYSWVINFQKQCIKSDFFIVDIDSFIYNMFTILNNLEESINNSELNLKREVYLLEIHTLRIHLLMECKFELRDSLLSWFKESFSVNQEIIKEMNKFFNSSHAFLHVDFNKKCCIDNNLLDISYWITQSQEVVINENDNEYNLSNEMFLIDNNSNLEEIDDDIPIPLGNVKTNKINLSKENRKYELNYTRKTKTQSCVRNNVRFAISGGYSEANTKTMPANNNNEFSVTEVKILVYNSLKLLDIIEFQGINNIYRSKLLNILLYFFSNCWTFCIKYRKFSNSVNKKICDLIDYSLRNIIKTKISLSDEIDDQYDILLINFGVLISKLLYKAANCQKDISSSDDYLMWLEIAHLYNKHLIALIEDKYILSKTFLSEKLPNSYFGSVAIFKLVVLQIENIHIERSYIEIFDLLNYLDGLEFPDLSECNILNIALFARLYRRLSKIFDNSRKPELSLFLILESNKFTQALIQSLDNYINDIRPDLAVFSFNGVSKTSIVGVIINSLIDLGVSWWKIGEIERSHSIFIRVYNFCREWTRSYINILKILFYQLPILFSLTKNVDNMNNLNDINGLNCTSDSSNALDLNYSIDGINQLMSDLCDIYYYYSQFDGCNDFNFSDEKIMLMIIIYLLFYSSINSSENILNRLKILDFLFPDVNTTIIANNDFAMCLVLKKILRRLINTKNNDIDILLNIFLELNFGIDDYYFNIFYMTILNYTLLITSSKYIDSVAATIEKNKKAAQFKTSENVSVYLLLNNILDDEARHQPNFKSCKINSIAKELIKKATDVKSTFFDLFKADFKNCMDFNRNIGLDEYIFNTLSLLLDKHRNPGKNFNTKIKILKEINELFDVILHYIIFCFKHNTLILVNNIISIVIDLILLISSLTYPVQKLISAFSDIASSLTNLLSIYNPSLYIHSMRKMQKIFENHKKKESKEHVICFETLSNKVFFNNLKYISSFILKLDESKTNIKDDAFYLNDIIPRIHIRFSSFFSTFSSRIITEKTKFSLFQITRDISISKNIKQNVSSVRRKSDSFIPTNLTVFYFIESSKICNLLGSFYEIQRENILSIIDVDVDQKSSRKAKDWWSRRINLELKLEAWLSSFKSLIFKDWTTKLLFGFPKKLSNSKYNSIILSYLDDSLKGYKSIGIFDIVLYSLLTNTPNLISLLNYVTITNFDFSLLYKYFNKTILRGATKCDIKNYPVIIFPDKLLMNIPIEGISELLLQPITRGLNSKVSMDNFIYLMNKIGNKGNNKCLLAKICNIYYFINPSGDLSDTEKIIVPAISKLFKEGNCMGISNSIPQPISMMNEININSTNLYLFCGHQAGEKFIKGESIERGITTSDSLGSEIFNFPPSLLIGCSSSRIRSYETNDIFCTPIYYLIGGSPFILGALWDVTDQDIDRFTLSIFDNWFKSNLSLLESITVSRRSCKLPLLNGSSCVCFGHPL